MKKEIFEYKEVKKINATIGMFFQSLIQTKILQSMPVLTNF